MKLADKIYPSDKKLRARKGTSYNRPGTSHHERSIYHKAMDKILREREKRER